MFIREKGSAAKHEFGKKCKKKHCLLERLGIGKQPQLEVSQPLTGQTVEKNWPLQYACITYLYKCPKHEWLVARHKIGLKKGLSIIQHQRSKKSQSLEVKWMEAKQPV